MMKMNMSGTPTMITKQHLVGVPAKSLIWAMRSTSLPRDVDFLVLHEGLALDDVIHSLTRHRAASFFMRRGRTGHLARPSWQPR